MSSIRRGTSLLNKTINNWTVIEKLPNSYWLCQCVCGRTSRVDTHKLLHGESKQCLSCAARVHGDYYLPAYGRWRGMLDRCNNPKFPGYRNYGGRGINVCERWNTFRNFYEDMGDPPPGTSLDRIDVNLGYCKENCRWTTTTIQCINTRVRSDSLSGIKGVTWCSKLRRWRATIVVSGVQIHLGYHADVEGAICTRAIAEAMRYRALVIHRPPSDADA